MDDVKDNDERLKFEHELINRRLTWLLSSQGIFFAALAIALNRNSIDTAPEYLCQNNIRYRDSRLNFCIYSCSDGCNS